VNGLRGEDHNSPKTARSGVFKGETISYTLAIAQEIAPATYEELKVKY
jgi:hypothetical protein